MIIKQINKQYKDFNVLYKRNFFFLKKMSVYCTGFTMDDIYEIAVYCYFVHNFQSMIDNKVLTDKEIDNRFRYLFKKEVARDNSYTYDIRTNDELYKVIDKFNTIAADEIDETNIEDLIIDKIMYDRLLTVMTQEDLDFCLMYLRKGHKYTAAIYSISSSTARKRYQRILEKARKKVK